ncbi:MAG TPA: hypothetical protein VM536_01470 [Chloroflexia bacterium]|nr:hypothetical protein [Chloroflexia bacterium]
MGTWISHLRVAENLLAHSPDLDAACFACGNLAPDSGIPNADWTQFDPPKAVTHFLQPGEDEGRIADLAFYRQYLTAASRDADPARYSFRLGYFCHLLCDNLWALRAGTRFKQDYASLFAAQGAHAWWELKRDWYGLDHQYVRDHPDSLFWRVFVPAPNPPSDLPFVPDAALHHQLDHIRGYYSAPDPDVMPLDRPYPYLNAAAMDRFVADATAAVLQMLDILQARRAPPDGATALDLLPADQIAPYDPPLGDIAALRSAPMPE